MTGEIFNSIVLQPIGREFRICWGMGKRRRRVKEKGDSKRYALSAQECIQMKDGQCLDRGDMQKNAEKYSKRSLGPRPNRRLSYTAPPLHLHLHFHLLLGILDGFIALL